MELNAEKIIKALECCYSNGTCDGCPNSALVDCRRELERNTLLLIKELTEDVERVRKQCGEIIVECDERDAERLKQVAELTEEKERLIDECENQSLLWKQHFESIYETAKETIKEDTVRKMHSLCKERATIMVNAQDEQAVVVDVEDIDQIAKEMLEGNDESKG